MNRDFRRKKQKELNRKIRQRERELRRNIKRIDTYTEDQYLSQEEAIRFLEQLSTLNAKQKRKYEDE